MAESGSGEVKFDLASFQEAFEDKFFPGWRNWPLIYWTNALAAEAGKLAAIMRATEFGGGTRDRDPSPDEILDQAVDARIVLENLRLAFGWTQGEFDAAVQKKCEINAARMAERERDR